MKKPRKEPTVPITARVTVGFKKRLDAVVERERRSLANVMVLCMEAGIVKFEAGNERR